MGPNWHCHRGTPVFPVPHQNGWIRQQSLRNRKFLRKYIPVYQPASRRSILEDIVHFHPLLPTDDNTTPLYSYLPHLHTPRKETIPPPLTTTRVDMEVNSPKVTPTSGRALPYLHLIPSQWRPQLYPHLHQPHNH